MLHVGCVRASVIIQICECSSETASLPHPQRPPTRDGPKGSLLPLVSVPEPGAGRPESLPPHLPCQGALRQGEAVVLCCGEQSLLADDVGTGCFYCGDSCVRQIMKPELVPPPPLTVRKKEVF